MSWEPVRKSTEPEPTWGTAIGVLFWLLIVPLVGVLWASSNDDTIHACWDAGGDLVLSIGWTMPVTCVNEATP